MPIGQSGRQIETHELFEHLTKQRRVGVVDDYDGHRGRLEEMLPRGDDLSAISEAHTQVDGDRAVRPLWFAGQRHQFSVEAGDADPLRPTRAAHPISGTRVHAPTGGGLFANMKLRVDSGATVAGMADPDAARLRQIADELRTIRNRTCEPKSNQNPRYHRLSTAVSSVEFAADDIDDEPAQD